jgi:hypothetical protein
VPARKRGHFAKHALPGRVTARLPGCESRGKGLRARFDGPVGLLAFPPTPTEPPLWRLTSLALDAISQVRQVAGHPSPRGDRLVKNRLGDTMGLKQRLLLCARAQPIDDRRRLADIGDVYPGAPRRTPPATASACVHHVPASTELSLDCKWHPTPARRTSRRGAAAGPPCHFAGARLCVTAPAAGVGHARNRRRLSPRRASMSVCPTNTEPATCHNLTRADTPACGTRPH